MATRVPTAASAKRTTIITTARPTAFGACESSRTTGFAGRRGSQDGDSNEGELAGRAGISISCAGTGIKSY